MSKAIKISGLLPISKSCGVSYQAVRKWEKFGLPNTEWTGETRYAHYIETLTKGKVTKEKLWKWSLRVKALRRR